jgi:hypothetical protein
MLAVVEHASASAPRPQITESIATDRLTSTSIAHMSASAITSASSEEHQVATAAMNTTITSLGRFSATLTSQHTKKVR